ncbi:hypothetical protein A8H39_22040 [Paraburkholderia fungorum]|nr:hypothetical protein KBK24_0128025 [Burkholderia sp. K24]PNE58265.1 hypothetical protein A8H39_22040 [Paraburkholderia fungorum]PZR50132.1 MAG: hypothetical protein DI523_05480 [Paraburkholderia fungorum]
MAQSPFFSASCLALGGTRCNGTVPLNQNLIQSRRRSFNRSVPVATAAPRNASRSTRPRRIQIIRSLKTRNAGHAKRSQQ